MLASSPPVISLGYSEPSVSSPAERRALHLAPPSVLQKPDRSDRWLCRPPPLPLPLLPDEHWLCVGCSDRCCGRERVFPERAQPGRVKGPIVSCRRGLAFLCSWSWSLFTLWRGRPRGEAQQALGCGARARARAPGCRSEGAGISVPAAVLSAGAWR